ncbi:transcription factor vrtR1 [Penicillium canariense]|uniref:Transcription factor vrtR1 n=1 Tax=Penicillium canariense TaxID=189055 RepID=A0A9W9LGJ0_9EURO|nr:transcription factor vrtR1 [Penicillium canariense]KAJ5153200.1 transcription factor vrtR1 [Penicillium canariense]
MSTPMPRSTDPPHRNVRAASQQVPIAPAPAVARLVNAPSGAATELTTTMPFNCQACVRKKIKCDRGVPVCSSCRKSKLQCVYKAPAPPRRKRRRSQTQHALERILPENPVPAALSASASSTYDAATPVLRAQTPLAAPAAQPAKPGKLLSGDGKSRYVDNVLLLDDDEGNLDELSSSDQGESYSDDGGPDEGTPTGLLGRLAAHAVAGAVFGGTQSLTEQHPTRQDAMKLWDAYVNNVEPLCKVLHIPTVVKMVESVSQQPSTASKSEECLLFVIYYFAVFSMCDADCLREFAVSRNRLMSKYRSAVCQALVNASWLRTTALPVLQAYILFLIAMRSEIDPDTFWILTGIAIRLAQRMGLHRDGEKLGLPPFDIQMRRRLFWQLLPLDGYAGQVSGTGISISPDSWDTQPPLNINDDQIFPGMTEQPQEQRRATEMIFCLARIELSNFYTRTGVQMKHGGTTIQFRDAEDVERLIDEVEGLIETKFLRYCDILNPLHFLATGVVRSATDAIRLRTRMPPLIKQTINDTQRKELCALAQTILDRNSAIYSNLNLKKFRWQMRAFFLWDALLCILLSLVKVGFYSPSELNATWGKVGEVYSNYEELAKGKQSLRVSIGRATLKAWIANPPSNAPREPAFITALRAQAQGKEQRREQSVNANAEVDSEAADPGPVFDELFGNMDGADMNHNGDFSLSSLDWAFWDQS